MPCALHYIFRPLEDWNKCPKGTAKFNTLPWQEQICSQRCRMSHARGAARLPAPRGLEARQAHLRGDAGVVGAGDPEGGAAAHALVAHHRVLQRHEHGVAHVQAPRHVRRWHGCAGMQ